MNELQVRQALLSQAEILSFKYSGIGSVTISLVSTKHWVAEMGLIKVTNWNKSDKKMTSKTASKKMHTLSLQMGLLVLITGMS